MNINEFYKYLKKGTFSNLELLITSENYVINQFIEKIIQKRKNFDKRMLFGSEIEASNILNELYQNDLFAREKILIIKEFESVRWDSDSLQAFLRIVNGTNFPHQLVLVTSNKKLIPKEILTHISQKGHLIELRSIYPNELFQYIQNYVQSLDKTISSEAINELINHVGTDLQEVHNQLEKIILYKKNENSIELKDIEQIVGITSHFNIFQLIDALFAKNVDNVLQISQSILESGQHPLLPLSVLIKQFQQLEFYCHLRKAGRSKQEINNILKLRDFQLNKLEKYSYLYSVEKIEKIIQLLDKLDHEIKMRQLPTTHFNVVFTRYMLEIIKIL